VVEQLDVDRLERGDDGVQLTRHRRLFSRLEVANRAGWNAGAAA
jgi:hypothetical protein